MSARVRPVGGRASAMLSIFTASTRPSDFTGSPVNGDSNCFATCGVGLGAGARMAFGALLAPRPDTTTPAATSPATTTTETTTTTGWAAHARAMRLLSFPSTAPLPPDEVRHGSLGPAAASSPRVIPLRSVSTSIPLSPHPPGTDPAQPRTRPPRMELTCYVRRPAVPKVIGAAPATPGYPVGQVCTGSLVCMCSI